MRPAVALALVGLASCHRAAAPAREAEPPALTIPRATGPITIDGEVDEASWHQAFRSPPFEDSRGRIAPYADVRLTGDDERLYVTVYVSDDDLRGDADRVHLAVGPLAFDLTPRTRTLSHGARVAMDLDGTVDDDRDLDEEWVNEVAIPWRAIGGEKARDEGVLLRVTRLDARARGRTRALAWPRAAPVRIRLAPKRST